MLSVYETDGYQGIMSWIAEASGVAYGDSPDATKAHRVLADHGRGMTFLRNAEQDRPSRNHYDVGQDRRAHGAALRAASSAAATRRPSEALRRIAWKTRTLSSSSAALDIVNGCSPRTASRKWRTSRK